MTSDKKFGISMIMFVFGISAFFLSISIMAESHRSTIESLRIQLEQCNSIIDSLPKSVSRETLTLGDQGKLEEP